ncbi:hypothetical protein ACQ5SK_19800 [Bradyrhizobium japonicum]
MNSRPSLELGIEIDDLAPKVFGRDLRGSLHRALGHAFHHEGVGRGRRRDRIKTEISLNPFAVSTHRIVSAKLIFRRLILTSVFRWSARQANGCNFKSKSLSPNGREY